MKVYDNVKYVDVDSLVHNEKKRKGKYKNFSKFPKLINKKSKYLEESFCQQSMIR